MKFLLCLTVSLFSQVALAKSCSELKHELKAMQQAQQTIMQSLVNNHETFSSTLEEFSGQIFEAEISTSASVSAEMNHSAESFRKRGVRAKQLSQKLNQSTQDLLARVASCLK